ncbi:MAG: hypothetical protein HQK51_13480 [Oligoflexia bacterium]|nr:hypothetical protein [Oligoflexia bacterium]
MKKFKTCKSSLLGLSLLLAILVNLPTLSFSFAASNAVKNINGNKNFVDINWSERAKEMEEMASEIKKIKLLENAVLELKNQVNAQNVIIEKYVLQVNSLEKKVSPMLETYSPAKTIRIEGDANIYYPVWFAENIACWNDGESRLQIAKANVHADGQWSGSMISRFVFHSSMWGHGSNYLEAALEATSGNKAPYVADFEMPFYPAGVVVWLKGGGETYSYKSNCPITATADLEKPIVLYENADHPEYRVVKNSINKISEKVMSSLGKGWTRFPY